MQRQIKSSSEEGNIILGLKLFQQIFYKCHVQHATKDDPRYGQMQNFLATQKISFTHSFCGGKIKQYDGDGLSVWWRGRNQRLEGMQMGLMKEGRGSSCFLKLGPSSENSIEQTPLLSALQSIAGPQVQSPETPIAQIFVSLQTPISKLGWRMVKLFLEGGPNHGPMKGTKVFRRFLAECSRLH